MLEVVDLAYCYKRGVNVLDGVSFTLSDGEILCLLGPNGTGKTTLLKCMLSLAKPENGSILVDGREVTGMSDRDRARLLAYVPQATSIAFPYTVHEVVLMGRISHYSAGGAARSEDHDRVDAALGLLGVEHLDECQFNEISGGERQMALLARAIVQDAKTLIMDEPTANLDYSNQVRMLRVIKQLSEEGYSILMTSHYPDHAFLTCHQAALMKGGVILAQGSPEEVLTTRQLSDLYGSSVYVVEAVLPTGKRVKTCIPDMDEPPSQGNGGPPSHGKEVMPIGDLQAIG